MHNIFARGAAVAIFAMSFALAGCGGGGSSADGGSGVAAVTISGAIAATPFVAAGIHPASVLDKAHTMTVSLANLEIYVIYTTGATVGIVQAAVNASTGAWSFSVPAGSAINAIVRNSASLELVGPITFVDPTQTDLSGNAKESTVQSFKSGVALGTITLTSTGKFQVDVSAPTISAATNTTVAAPATRIDFSGAWTIAAYDGTLPTGYVTAVAVGSPGCSTINSCNGTPVGQEVYFLRLSGKKFTYSGGNCATWKTAHTGSCATSDGTVDATVTKDAASIWGGATAIGACGYKLGFAQADALSGGGIDVEPADLPSVGTHQMGYGAVVLTTDASYGGDTGAGNNQPWMKTGATMSQPMQSCTIVTKTGSDGHSYDLNVCTGKLHTATTTTAYGANYGGGCVDASGHPVQVYNWSTLGTPSSSCTNTAWVVAGMTSNSCPYTGVSPSVASAASFTCNGTFGTFTSAALTTPISSDYIDNWDSVTGACKDITNTLQKYRCYANAYYQSPPSGGCILRYNFDWNTTNPANFVKTDNREKPENNFLTNLVDYSADGNSFTLEDHENAGVQVQTGTGSSTFCNVDRATLMKGTKVSATKILLQLDETATLQDTTNTACVASKNDTTSNSGQGSELYQRTTKDSRKQMFYLVK